MCYGSSSHYYLRRPYLQNQDILVLACPGKWPLNECRFETHETLSGEMYALFRVLFALKLISTVQFLCILLNKKASDVYSTTYLIYL